MDFTIKVYNELLTTLQKGGFSFQTFKEFLEGPDERVVILRHDVDLLPKNSLVTAYLENNLGIKGTYYFRIIQESFDVSVITQIYALGHEVGYHYENMEMVAQIEKKNSKLEHIDAAYQDFRMNLEQFKKIVPVHTIAMHGSPRSPFNNLDIWGKYDYKELGIIGEPYLDVDFSKVFYLTDTGRRWDGASVSIRDKVESGFTNPELKFRSTHEIIAAVKSGKLPNLIMINVHPQRWTDKAFPWLKELIWQNIKNQVKKLMVKK